MTALFAFVALIIAVLAYSNAKAGERNLLAALRTIRDLSNQLAAMSANLQALRKQLGLPEETSAPPTPEPVVAAPATVPQMAKATVPGEVVARPAAPPPPPPPKKAPARGRNLEEAFTSRWLVWLGALAIALAGTFFVRYAIDHGFLGPVARVTLGFLGGIALALAGEWLRRRPLQRAIAAVRTNQVPPSLTAAGLFTAFVSIYAAYALYNLLSPLAAFMGLALVALLGIALSLLHGRFVAFMGLFGAFAAPAMIDTPNPSAWSLFAYLLVVEAACLAVARYRSWWTFAFATLAGAAAWPFLWLLDTPTHAADVPPLGVYLLLSVSAFFALRRGMPEPETQANWTDEFQGFRMPEWVVWVAACTIAVVLYIVVEAADYNAAGMIFVALTAMLYLVMARRYAILVSLCVVAALLALLVVISMPVPEIAVVHSAFRDTSWIPAKLQYFAVVNIVFGALFGIFGFGALWGSHRPALWAGVSAAMPVLLLVNAYYRVNAFGVDISWALLALALAVMALIAAGRVERYRAARGLEITLAFYAAAVVALVSLAAAMSVRQAWLTVALSLQVPALALIHTRVRSRSLQIMAAILVFTVLLRLVFNYNILNYPLDSGPATSWVIYGYGIPAISFLWAARIFRPLDGEWLASFLEAAGFVFCVLLVSLEIRLFVTGSLATPRYELLEQSLQSISWLGIGAALAVYHRKTGREVALYAGMALIGLATLQVFVLQLLAFNPMLWRSFVGTMPIFNVLLLAYAVPAAFAFGISFALVKTKFAKFADYAAGAGFVLTFAYISLETMHAFQGPRLDVSRSSDAEIYAYSVVWMIYAVALLALGITFGKSQLRYASLGVLIVTVSKVFLSDMSGLTGLYRVASFLGLGLTMIGIGYIYQRFVFPRPSTR